MTMDPDELVKVRAAYDREMRRDAPPDTAQTRVERVGAVVRQSAEGPGWNAVLWSDLDEGTADAEIAAQVAYFAGRGAGRFEWKLYDHDRPADLGDRLRAAGFVPEPAETLLVGRAQELAALPVEPPEGITLRAVTDGAGVDLMMDVHAKAFGVERPEIRHLLLTLLRDEPQTLAAVVAMAGDVPVSAARMEMRPGSSFAGLWGGGTLPGGGAGVCTASWSRTGPASRRPAASPTSRWTPRRTAARSSSAWASRGWARRCRTCGGGRSRGAGPRVRARSGDGTYRTAPDRGRA